MRTILFTIVLFVTGGLLAQKDSVNLDPDIPSLEQGVHLISFDGIGTIPMLYQLDVGRTYSFTEKKGELVSKKLLFHYGARFTYTYVFNKRIGLGAELGIDKYQIQPSGLALFGTHTVHHEMLDVLTYSILPKVELRKKKKANLPHDFSSQLGVGVTITNIVDRDYAYTVVDEDTTYPFPFESLGLYNYSHKPFIGITLLYAMNYRIKLSDNLLLNLGTRVTLNGNFKAWPFDEPSSNLMADPNDKNYWISRENMRRKINGNRITSLVNFNVGLTYLFKKK